MNFLFSCLTGFFRLFSPKALQAVGRFIGTILWLVLPTRRKRAIESAMAHLEVSEKEAERIIRESFKHSATAFLEIFHSGLTGENSPEIVIATPEAYERLKAEAGPVVAATAHLGSWEKMAGIMGDIKPGTDRMIVVRNFQNKRVNEMIFKLRGERGATIIGHRNVSGRVLSGLRADGIAAFLVDHNASVDESVFLPFLGEQAAVNAGPAILAVRSKAVVYGVFLIRESDGTYHFHVTDPLRTEALTGPMAQRIEAVARFYTEAVEKMVRKYPEQWFWMHNRWKTKFKLRRRAKARTLLAD